MERDAKTAAYIETLEKSQCAHAGLPHDQSCDLVAGIEAELDALRTQLACAQSMNVGYQDRIKEIEGSSGGATGDIGTTPASEPDDSTLCECDLRDRAWNPNTGKCETCARDFKIWVNKEWWAKAKAAAKVEMSSGGDPLCGGDNTERTCRAGHKYITNVDEPGLCWCGERAELKVTS